MWDGKIPTAFTLAEDENNQVLIVSTIVVLGGLVFVTILAGLWVAIGPSPYFSHKLCSSLTFQIFIVIIVFKTSVPLYLNATSVNVKKMIPTFGEELDKLTRVI